MSCGHFSSSSAWWLTPELFVDLLPTVQGSRARRLLTNAPPVTRGQPPATGVPDCAHQSLRGRYKHLVTLGFNSLLSHLMARLSGVFFFFPPPPAFIRRFLSKTRSVFTAVRDREQLAGRQRGNYHGCVRQRRGV